MKHTIFYSWQSDLPNNVNRSFIEQALEAACKMIRGDNSVSVEPVLDRDTSGIAGSPEISNTIFRKIDDCAVFVADVTIVNASGRARKSPNPNVLIELGYALRSLGPERVLMIMNLVYGGPEKLPFDLRLRRVLTYTASPIEKERSVGRKELGKRVEQQLRIILDELDRAAALQPQIALFERVREIIRTRGVDRTFVTREYLGDFFVRPGTWVTDQTGHIGYTLCLSFGRSMAGLSSLNDPTARSVST